MPALGGLLRRQDAPSGLGGGDPNAVSPAALLNGRGRQLPNSNAAAASEFARRGGSSPGPQPDAYAAALSRSPSQTAPQNHTGSTTAGAAAAAPPGSSGDYMAAMGGDWWKAWNAMLSAAAGSPGQVRSLIVLELRWRIS